MSAPPPDEDPGVFVTNRQLYDSLIAIRTEFATKSDVKVWVGAGLVGGQVVASAVTAWVTRLSPAEQVAAIAHAAVRLLT